MESPRRRSYYYRISSLVLTLVTFGVTCLSLGSPYWSVLESSRVSFYFQNQTKVTLHLDSQNGLFYGCSTINHPDSVTSDLLMSRLRVPLSECFWFFSSYSATYRHNKRIHRDAICDQYAKGTFAAPPCRYMDKTCGWTGQVTLVLAICIVVVAFIALVLVVVAVVQQHLQKRLGRWVYPLVVIIVVLKVLLLGFYIVQANNFRELFVRHWNGLILDQVNDVNLGISTTFTFIGAVFDILAGCLTKKYFQIKQREEEEEKDYEEME